MRKHAAVQHNMNKWTAGTNMWEWKGNPEVLAGIWEHKNGMCVISHIIVLDAHVQTHATLKNTQLHKRSMDERISIGLPVGAADMYQYNWINPPPSQRSAAVMGFAVIANTITIQSLQRQSAEPCMKDKRCKRAGLFLSVILRSPTSSETERTWAAVLHDLSAIQFQLINFLKRLKLMWTENNAGTSRPAVRTFSWRSRACMWQCQSRCISSCTRAGWCNPDLWVKHMASATHIFPVVPHPTVDVWILWCFSRSEHINQSLVGSSGPRPKTACGPFCVSSYWV